MISGEAFRQDPRRRRVRRAPRPADLVRVRAAALLQELAACETALDARNGRQPAAGIAGLLRGLVIAVRDLAGPAWLEASAGDPDVAAFIAMQATASPPDPPILPGRARAARDAFAALELAGATAETFAT